MTERLFSFNASGLQLGRTIPGRPPSRRMGIPGTAFEKSEGHARNRPFLPAPPWNLILIVVVNESVGNPPSSSYLQSITAPPCYEISQFGIDVFFADIAQYDAARLNATLPGMQIVAGLWQCSVFGFCGSQTWTHNSARIIPGGLALTAVNARFERDLSELAPTADLAGVPQFRPFELINLWDTLARRINNEYSYETLVIVDDSGSMHASPSGVNLARHAIEELERHAQTQFESPHELFTYATSFDFSHEQWLKPCASVLNDWVARRLLLP